MQFLDVSVQNLDIISVNLWQILISLANLLILFLLLKKFLYKPVKKALSERQNAVDEQYRAAADAQAKADADRAAWNEKLQQAQEKADAVIDSATAIADRRSQQIVDDARQKADGILRQAQAEAQLEKQKAEADVRQEIVDVSALMTEKILRREISATDHRRLIDSFIEDIDDE